MKKDVAIIFLFIGILGVLAFCYQLLAILPHAHPPSTYMAAAVSNLKQIRTATIIYTTDYDDRYPHATAMAGHRSSIYPYVKNIEILKPQPNINSEYLFNFNLAGANIESKPLGYPPTFDTSIVTAYYSFITNKKVKGEVIQAYMDTHVNITTRAKLFTNFQYQYDRKGVTLAPTDYLADQDPLKETK
ncbi:MAG: hypothetical protein ACKVQS_12035 [Fimbriimonadaceae bacterium]